MDRVSARHTSRIRSASLVLLVSSIVATGREGMAAEKPQSPAGVSTTPVLAGHPHCGLYCLYTTMKLAGMNVDIQELIKPEYVGSKKGSSLLELQQAAEDYGMYAEPVAKLTLDGLRESRYPIILHVKSDFGSGEYGHYELFLGMDGGKLRLFDPPQLVELVPFRDLAPRWAGNGLLLSTEPVDTADVLAPGRRRLGACIVLGLAVVVAVRVIGRRWATASGRQWPVRSLLRLSAKEAVAFGTLALLTGLLYHFAEDAGFLSHPRAAEAVRMAHQGNFIPKVGMKQVRAFLDDGTVFVDARVSRDFDTGHFDGAISVPVDTDGVERDMAMANVSKDVRIVVYCQSARCKFAETVAIRLIDDGYSDIRVYKGGWAEWEAANGSVASAGSEGEDGPA